MSVPESQTAAGPDTRQAAPIREAQLAQFLMYTVSLPERVVRSTVGVAAGAASEAAHALIPQAFQSSKTYEVVVNNSLRFLTEDVGGVESKDAQENVGESDQYLARKAVASFVDFAGMATLHVSPLWAFALVSDMAYGSKTYLRELAAELRQRGLIDQDSTIDRVDDLLNALHRATSETATLLDSPPLSVDQLKLSLERTRNAIATADPAAILPEAELRNHWNEMRAIAAKENVSLLGVSGALTLHMLGKVGTVTRGAIAGAEVASGLVNRHVVEHYADALRTVREKGFYSLVRSSATPYVTAVWKNFAKERETLTSLVLSGRLFRRAWQTIRRRIRGPAASPRNS